MTRVLHRFLVVALLAVALLALRACASPDGTSGIVGVSHKPDLGGFIDPGDMTLALAKADLAAGSDDLSSSVPMDFAPTPVDFATKPVDLATKPVDMATPSGCGSVTYAGSCSGNTVVYCSSNQVTMLTCSSPRMCNVVAGDANCRYVDGSACGSVNNDGLCDGNTLVYCNTSSSTLSVTDCTSFGSTCAVDSTNFATCK